MAGTDGGLRRGLILPSWVAGPDVGALVEAAVRAEAAGWDGVFLADHIVFPPTRVGGNKRAPDMPLPDPWITLAGIATRTEQITLGTWVTPVGRRQPWQVARDLATLDQLSDGRVLFGIGLGRGTDFAPFGRASDLRARAAACDEALAVIDALWSGEPVTHDGELHHLDEVVVLPRPRQHPRVPVVVGGLWPHRAVVRRGARWDGIIPHFPGDGVLPGDDTPPEQHVRDLVGAYHEAAGTPGQVLLLGDPPEASDEYAEVCADVGVTWLLHGPGPRGFRVDQDRIDFAAIDAGPAGLG